MGAPEITRFLSSLAVDGKVAASTQNQALSALLFMYREVLELDLPWLDGIVRAKRPQRLPVVLTRDEVRTVLQPLKGVPRLMACLLYGAGLRLLECCQLRVQDLDFGANQIVVRSGKGQRSGHDVAGRNEGRSGAASRDRAAAAPAGPRAGCGVGRAPHRAPPEVPECGPRVGVAVGVPRDALLRGPGDGSAAPPPPARVRAPARSEGCRPPSRDP